MTMVNDVLVRGLEDRIIDYLFWYSVDTKFFRSDVSDVRSLRCYVMDLGFSHISWYDGSLTRELLEIVFDCVDWSRIWDELLMMVRKQKRNVEERRGLSKNDF